MRTIEKREFLCPANGCRERLEKDERGIVEWGWIENACLGNCMTCPQRHWCSLMPGSLMIDEGLVMG